MIDVLLLVLALLCFILAAFGATIGHVALVPLGLAFWVGAYLVGGGWPRRTNP